MQHISLHLFVPFLLAPFAWTQSDPMAIRVDRGPTGNSVRDCKIAVSGTSIYVAWDDRRNTMSTLGDVYFNGSRDGGSTWLSVDIRVSAHPTMPTLLASDPQIAADGNNVLVSWRATNNAVYCNCSRDGGLTWLSSPFRLTAPLEVADDPQLTIENGVAYVVWVSGTNQVSIRSSADYGATWLPSTRVNALTPGNPFLSSPDFVAIGNSVYVTWSDSRNGGTDVYCNFSHDAGVSWQAADIRLDTDAAGSAESYRPRIAATASSVHVVWYDFRGATQPLTEGRIYCNSSLDGGATWQASDLRLDTGPNQGSYSVDPRIVAQGNSVCVVWRDAIPVSGIFSTHSNDGGVTFQSVPTRINALGSSVTDPELASSETVVSVVWEGVPQSSGPAFTYHDYSLDGGATWQAAETPLSTTLPLQTSSFVTDVAVRGGDVHAVWAARMPGVTEQIYVNIPFGSRVGGLGTPGTGGVAPSLARGGSAIRGELMTLDVFDGLGAANGALLIGFGPASQISLPILGGTLLVSPTLTLPVALGGSTGVAGSGSTSASLQLGPDPAFLGWNLNFQALCIDPGAAAGISMSNAVHVWIG